MIACVSCTCGSVDKLIRTRLDFYGYRDALTIPITRGKDKSKKFTYTLPQYPEIEMLRDYIDKCSKFAIVIGYDNDSCGWVDLAKGKAVENNIELENIIQHFA